VSLVAKFAPWDDGRIRILVCSPVTKNGPSVEVFPSQDERCRNQGSGYCRNPWRPRSTRNSSTLGVDVEIDILFPRPQHPRAHRRFMPFIGRVVRYEQLRTPFQACSFTAMNHATMLRETQGQKKVRRRVSIKRDRRSPAKGRCYSKTAPR